VKSSIFPPSTCSQPRVRSVLQCVAVCCNVLQCVAGVKSEELYLSTIHMLTASYTLPPPPRNHNATHCNTTHCNTLQRNAHAHSILYAPFPAMLSRPLPRSATHCSTLQHNTRPYCLVYAPFPAKILNTQQHTATNCNMLQHTATQATCSHSRVSSNLHQDNILTATH